MSKDQKVRRKTLVASGGSPIPEIGVSSTHCICKSGHRYVLNPLSLNPETYLAPPNGSARPLKDISSIRKENGVDVS